MRTVLGLILILVAAVAALVGAQSFADGYSAHAAGQLTGSLLLALIFGVVGLKMMQRRVRR